MAKGGFNVIDVEPHFHEPYDLWNKNLPEQYRRRFKIIAPENPGLADGTRLPKGWREGDMAIVDKTRNDDGSSITEGHTYKQGMRRWPSVPDLVRARNPHSDPEGYLECFDIEGVDIADIMPTTFGHIMTCDLFEPDFALAMCQVYNDWAHEFCRHDPRRLKFWGVVPLQDAKLAAKEAQRCIEELGAAGITAKDNGKYLVNDESLTPLWEALDAYHAVVGFHGFCEGRNIRRGDPGHTRVEWIKRASGPHATAVAGLILGGVLDKYPNIKPLFMESGANGVPTMLESMDDNWYLYRPDADFTIERWPSEYYKDRCYTVTRDEGLLKYSIDYLGDDKLVFSTDFPHHDCPFPNGAKKFVEMQGVSDESKRKILWDNALELLGISGELNGEPG